MFKWSGFPCFSLNLPHLALVLTHSVAVDSLYCYINRGMDYINSLNYFYWHKFCFTPKNHSRTVFFFIRGRGIWGWGYSFFMVLFLFCIEIWLWWIASESWLHYRYIYINLQHSSQKYFYLTKNLKTWRSESLVRWYINHCQIPNHGLVA